jgi:hypothetical protein
MRSVDDRALIVNRARKSRRGAGGTLLDAQPAFVDLLLQLGRMLHGL